MALSKEAIAIVLDVGPSMRTKFFNYLQKSTETISLILQRKIFSESKDEVALVLLGTEGTKNALMTKDEYINISVEYELMPVNFNMLQFVKEYSADEKTVDADFVDAIVVAMDELIKKTEGRKGYKTKRLILFCCGAGNYNEDMIEDIIDSFKNTAIELNVIDLNGTSENEIKKELVPKSEGKEMLMKLVETLDGMTFTFDEVQTYLQVKQAKSTAWKENLKISKNLEIPIMLYVKVKAAKAKCFKTVYKKDTSAEIVRERSYHLKNEEETEVNKEDVIEGHRFGDILVPVSAEDKEVFKFNTSKSFKLLGFTKAQHVRPEMYMGDTTWICIANPNDESAVLMLSTLIKACYELNLVGIARRVYAAKAQVRIGCLVPYIKMDYQCFYYIELPFANDTRQIIVPPLPLKSNNFSNKLKPTDEQLGLIDELMDTMKLGPELNFRYSKVHNPYLQRLIQCMEHRVFHPFDPLPPVTPSIDAIMKVPVELERASSVVVDKMKAAFVLEDMREEENKGNIFNRNSDSMRVDEKTDIKQEWIEDTNLMDMLKPSVLEIGDVTPVQDFICLLASTKDKSNVVTMMSGKIRQLILKSFSDNLYTKALDCMLALRQQCIMHSISIKYNQFIDSLRIDLKSSGRVDFLRKLSESNVNLGLITKEEDPEMNHIDEKDVNYFKQSIELQEDVKMQINDDNLIDELE